VLTTAADGGIVLAHATAARAVAAWTLAPAPRDPVRHLEAAHAQARRHLAQLTVHDPAREVPAVMTNELFSRLVVQRAAELSEVELDWLPPDGGWPLRRVLHHLARSERLYAAALDEASPDDDPAHRYEEACRRLDDGVRAAGDRGKDQSIVYAGLYGVLQTPEEVVGLVLDIEGELLASPLT